MIHHASILAEINHALHARLPTAEVLGVTLTGARQYGFTSPYATYDACVIYRMPTDYYDKDTFAKVLFRPVSRHLPHSHGLSMNIQAHEYGEALRTLRSKNAMLLHAVHSPLVLLSTAEFEALKDFAYKAYRRGAYITTRLSEASTLAFHPISNSHNCDRLTNEDRWCYVVKATHALLLAIEAMVHPHLSRRHLHASIADLYMREPEHAALNRLPLCEAMQPLVSQLRDAITDIYVGALPTGDKINARATAIEKLANAFLRSESVAEIEIPNAHLLAEADHLLSAFRSPLKEKALQTV